MKRIEQFYRIKSSRFESDNVKNKADKILVYTEVHEFCLSCSFLRYKAKE